MIVKSSSRLLLWFIVVFGLYLALTGHAGLGGGFAGGAMIALGYFLNILSRGKTAGADKAASERAASLAGIGGIFYIAIAFSGLAGGYFFYNVLFKSHELTGLLPAGTIQLENLAVALMTAAAISAVLNALTGFRVKK
jgi:multicomponent Na+:H+ antiporter subunit B